MLNGVNTRLKKRDGLTQKTVNESEEGAHWHILCCDTVQEKKIFIIRSSCVKKRDAMRYLTVQYKNNVEDIVPGPMLDELIASSSIKQFFRPSEQRWVLLGSDKTRGMGGSYEGIERRRFTAEVRKIKVTSHASMIL
jgi:hypothetical protein